MKRGPTNVAASVRARLTNLSRAEGMPFQSVFLRYMQERFLYRLANSRYADKFILKGGLLLYGASSPTDRPTVDIDLLGRGISRDELAAIIQEIASVPVDPPDGAVFFPESVKVESIVASTEYGGIRVRIYSGLDQAKVTLQIDIGFGDVIVPGPVAIDFPVLLGGLPARLAAYSWESAIAEKFDAMVRLSLSNSRMKDFYDVYTLSMRHDFDGRVLQEAIIQTLDRRGTPREREIRLFAGDVAADPGMNSQWAGFVKKMKNPGVAGIPFSDVITRINGERASSAVGQPVGHVGTIPGFPIVLHPESEVPPCNQRSKGLP